jgi:hypothetical protein
MNSPAGDQEIGTKHEDRLMLPKSELKQEEPEKPADQAGEEEYHQRDQTGSPEPESEEPDNLEDTNQSRGPQVDS